MALFGTYYTLLILAGILTVVTRSENATTSETSSTSDFQTVTTIDMVSTRSEIVSSQTPDTGYNTSEENTSPSPSNSTISMPNTNPTSTPSPSNIPTSTPSSNGSNTTNRSYNPDDKVKESTNLSPTIHKIITSRTTVPALMSTSSKTTEPLPAGSSISVTHIVTISGVIIMIFIIIISLCCFHKCRQRASFNLHTQGYGDADIPLNCPVPTGAFEPIEDQKEKKGDEQVLEDKATNDKASVTNSCLTEENEKQNNCGTEKNHNSASSAKENGDNMIDWNLQENIFSSLPQDANFSDIDFDDCSSV
ncbi:putative cell-type specific agglutination protein pfl7 [Callorhinchus milii]|uniref:putative cell-type specific agglutination protein pfl7 n=1 Tax=Callorhinchus milii TaxID=7868 RepID=UPI00045763A9|nr:putative cell-type specific agglutination protein pfl7 [Callorhinchus milii]|eukprot:gi/632962524/ref/XP_007897367.1/ PREDICTED: ras guanine nucleotide exchange factor P-like [Callorhinchus milii]